MKTSSIFRINELERKLGSPCSLYLLNVKYRILQTLQLDLAIQKGSALAQCGKLCPNCSKLSNVEPGKQWDG